MKKYIKLLVRNYGDDTVYTDVLADNKSNRNQLGVISNMVQFIQKEVDKDKYADHAYLAEDFVIKLLSRDYDMNSSDDEIAYAEDYINRTSIFMKNVTPNAITSLNEIRDMFLIDANETKKLDLDNLLKKSADNIVLLHNGIATKEYYI